MSTIPSSAMPHAYAEEGQDLRDPHGGKTEEERTPAKPPLGLLIGGAAIVLYAIYRAVR